MKILLAESFDASLAEKLRAYGEVTQNLADAATAEVVIVRSKVKVDKAFIDAAPNLKLAIRGGVGMDNIDKAYAESKNILVRNTPKASSIAVAELAFALMIALPNHLTAAHRSMVEGKWLKKELERTELYGKTLGVIGCGRIGQQLAKRAQAFGMLVHGYDPGVTESDYMQMEKDLQTLLGKCDYLSLHLPLNDSTRGLFNAELIAKTKTGVYIINTGRGKTIVEEDMVQALQSGKVAGYATDVYYSDPPTGSPLLSAPNVLLTPHLGAASKENMQRIGYDILELLDNYKSGRL
ncbi:MAG TPA: hydroxyacid dehydrogenase [bacterium]|nr:hydroxyacid dehydrogenase [bacterium]HPN34179.1 hydroxyacid dehydrogenase [bacterium]